VDGAQTMTQRAEERDLEQQLHTARPAIRAAVLRLLQAGEVDPPIIALAVAGVAGELGASLALAGEDDLERVLGDLADVVRQVGREHREMLEVAVAPAAGSREKPLSW
jgi:hypothetical protein